MRLPLTDDRAREYAAPAGGHAGLGGRGGVSERPTAIRWRVLVERQGRTGAENMALDQASLDEAERTGGAVLRLYRFDPPCISFGRNEPARERYDPDAIARLGCDVVRRPTGGRAVWHEHEVTYAVAAPLAAFGGDPRRGAACCAPTYRAIHQRLAAALRALGADATLAPYRRPPTSTDLHHLHGCFATPVGGEVLVHGRKLIGSAQVRQGRAFLQHGSILVDGSQEIITAVSRKPQGASAATTLSAILGRPVSFDEVVNAIIGTWEDAIAHTALDRPRPPSTARFTDPAWTWRR
jgi:lipoyl(octanoyl) transferase